MPTAERVEDIGNPKKLSKKELETGINVLTGIINETKEHLEDAQEKLQEKPLQEIEYNTLIQKYNSAIDRAEKMRRDYQREFGLK